MRALTNWLGDSWQWSSTALLFDIVVKATALILLAMLFLRFQPRASAALRHRVWCLVFCGLVALPVLCYMLPGWAVPILPSWFQEPRPVASQVDTATTASTVSDADLAEPRTSDRRFSDIATGNDDTAYAEKMFDPSRADRRVAAVPAAAMPNEAIDAAPPKQAETSGTAALINPLALWLVGAAVALLPLLAGIVRSAALRAKARNIQDASWIALRDQLCDRLRLKRAAQLLEVNAPIIPLSCGVVRPAVVLPYTAYQWNERLRRFVLLHELSHIQRHDVMFQLIARLACAIYWFHPLVWYALHRLRVERELACDDSVLAAGERPSDYAEQLLEVARSLQPVRLHAAVAMAQSNKLEHRVSLLFSRARSHLPLSTWTSRLLLACAVGIVIAVSVVRPSARATVEDSPAEGQSRATAENAEQKAENTKPNKIAGRVVGADGKPVEGARVLAVRETSEINTRPRKTELLSDTATDGEGRFEFPYPTEQPHSDFYLFATAAGHGLTWDYGGPARTGKECLLKLAPDDAPIEGRLLDLEGQPIAGVQVVARSITASADDIDEWIKRAKNNPPQGPPIEERYSYYYKPPAQPIARFPSQDSRELDHPKLALAATTDVSGRFRLTGLGSKRLVHLEVSGAGIAKGWINAVTHPMESVPYPEFDPRFRSIKCFGSRFDVALPPEQRIHGVVRDATTGQPLRGMEVRLRSFANYGMGSEPFISHVTDDEGRYELAGISKPGETDRGIALCVTPSADQPYFRTDVEAPRGKGLDAVACNVELKRAIWIRGSVVDERSGKPVRASVAYYPFLTNEAAKDYKNFDPGVQGIGDDYHYATADDGSFRIPGLSGRGILAVIADEDTHYPRAEGADAIGGLRRQRSSEPRHLYYLFTANSLNAVSEINPPAGAEEFRCDVRLQPFTPHKVRLLDPTGQPLPGVVAEGLTRVPIRGTGSMNRHEAGSSSIVDVLGLIEDQPRYVRFAHRGRGLAAMARLTIADFPDDKPKDVTLRPAATIMLRLADPQGTPLYGASAFATVDVDGADKSTGYTGRWTPSIGNTAKAEGPIRIEHLPPDVKYVLRVYTRQHELAATLQVGPLKPGEQLDLGAVKLSPPSAAADKPPSQPKEAPKPADAKDKPSEAASTAQPADSKQGTVLAQGRVVAADGKPVARAQVLVMRVTRERPQKTTLLAETETDGEGRFELPYAKEQPNSDLYVVAKAPGHGLTWQLAESPAAGKKSLLRLAPDDAPIEGRVINLEGQPIAGVRVTARSISGSADTIDQWIKTVRENPAPRSPLEAQAQAQLARFPVRSSLELDHPKLAITATTDADGRFRLTGLGSKRHVRIALSGGGIADSWINALTYLTEPVPYRESDPRFRVPNCFGARFDVVMEPGMRVTGAVRDAPTGQPLRGVVIRVQSPGDRRLPVESYMSDVTDANGRYQLEGLPKLGPRNRGVPFQVLPAPDQPYFHTHLVVRPTDESNAVVHNIELKRAMWIRGRIVDDRSGNPVKGGIAYYPFLTNEAAKEYPNFKPELSGLEAPMYATMEDGSFRIPGLAGRGILTVVAEEEGRFPLAEGADAIGGLRRKSPREPALVYLFVTADVVNAVREINPPVGVEEFEYEIRLNAFAPHKIRLIDSNGEPLAGVTVEGLTRMPFPGRPPVGRARDAYAAQPSAVIDVFGLAEDQPRYLKFVHNDRRLTSVVRLTVEDFVGDKPKDILLPAAATITGRLVDQKGAAVAGATAVANLVDILNFFREAQAPRVISPWSYTWRDQSGPDGRFRFYLVPPNVELKVDGINLANREAATLQVGPLKPGEQRDLGDVQVAPR